MALSIRRFSHQNMLVEVPFSLNIKVRGETAELASINDVVVDGLPDNFYYNWNASRNRIQIRGTPERIIYDREMIVVVEDVVYRQTYSVLPVLPSYNTDIVENIVKSIPFTLGVVIENIHDDISIEGPYIGLKYKRTIEGFDFYGTIPQGFNFTKDEFVFNVDVTNKSGVTHGTITLTSQELSDINFYILDGNNTIKVYPSIAVSSTLTQTLSKSKEFTLPNIPGVSNTNYIALTSDGTNIYALHSAGPSSNENNLDDQIVVVSPATRDGNVAGIIRRFDITRTSHYRQHNITDIHYHDGKLHILTVDTTTTANNSYFILEDIEGTDITRITQTHSRGGGITLSQGLLTAILYDQYRVAQGNFFRIYPPSWVTGVPRISDSGQTYTTLSAVRPDFTINNNDLSMTSINNHVYILSATLPNKISTLELPTPTNRAAKRNEITLNQSLTSPQGITAL